MPKARATDTPADAPRPERPQPATIRPVTEVSAASEETEQQTPAAKPVPAGIIDATPAEGSRVRKEVKATWVEDAPPKEEPPKPRLPLPSLLTPPHHTQPAIRLRSLNDFLLYWRTREPLDDSEDVSRFKMAVTREADEPLMPGQSQEFSNPATAERYLGMFRFDPEDDNKFIGTLQRINGNSGGLIRIVLHDADGYPVRSWGRVDARGNLIPGTDEVNYFWVGQIPNPFGVSTQQPKPQQSQPERKTLTFTEQLQELKSQKELLQSIMSDGKENTGNDSNPLRQIDAQATALYVSTVAGAIKAAGDAAASVVPKDEPERGFFGTIGYGIATNPRTLDRLIDVGEGFLTMAGGIAENFINKRLNKNAAGATGSDQTGTTVKEPTVYDYILSKCEKQEDIDFLTDPQILKWKAAGNVAAWTQIRGALASMEPERILSLFVDRCRAAGRGKEAEAVAARPWASQWVKRLKRGVAPDSEETPAEDTTTDPQGS